MSAPLCFVLPGFSKSQHSHLNISLMNLYFVREIGFLFKAHWNNLSYNSNISKFYHEAICCFSFAYLWRSETIPCILVILQSFQWTIHYNQSRLLLGISLADLIPSEFQPWNYQIVKSMNDYEKCFLDQFLNLAEIKNLLNCVMSF